VLLASPSPHFIQIYFKGALLQGIYYVVDESGTQSNIAQFLATILLSLAFHFLFLFDLFLHKIVFKFDQS